MKNPITVFNSSTTVKIRTGTKLALTRLWLPKIESVPTYTYYEKKSRVVSGRKFASSTYTAFVRSVNTDIYTFLIQSDETKMFGSLLRDIYNVTYGALCGSILVNGGKAIYYGACVVANYACLNIIGGIAFTAGATYHAWLAGECGIILASRWQNLNSVYSYLLGENEHDCFIKASDQYWNVADLGSTALGGVEYFRGYENHKNEWTGASIWGTEYGGLSDSYNLLTVDYDSINRITNGNASIYKIREAMQDAKIFSTITYRGGTWGE